MKTIRVITTVGTSIFTNYMDSKVKKVFELNNKEPDDIEAEFKEIKDKNVEEYEDELIYINIIKKSLNEYWIKGISKCGDDWEIKDGYNFDSSAEIKSLNLIQQQENANVIVELIATDTILSKVSSEIIKENINDINSNISVNEIHVIKGLQVNDCTLFKEVGAQELFKKLSSISKEKDKKENKEQKIYLNISGGYKALIPHITIYGELYGIPLKYMYEESDELITIEKLPIKFDWFFAERNYQYLFTPDLYDINELSEVINYGIVNKKNKRLTPFGDLLKQYIDRNMPISNNIMGYFMEYKVYEYLTNYTYYNYNVVKHSVRKKTNYEKTSWIKYREFDLMLFEKDYDYSNFIIGEVKSYYQIRNYYREFKKQLISGKKDKMGQLELIKESKNIPLEYHLYVYISKGQKFDEDFKRNVKNIEEIINNKISSCKFKVFKVEIEYSTDKNPYKFMDMPLEKNDIQEYKFD